MRKRMALAIVGAMVVAAGCSGGGGGGGGGLSLNGLVGISKSTDATGSTFNAFAILVKPALPLGENPLTLADGTCTHYKPTVITTFPTVLDAGSSLTLSTPGGPLSLSNNGFGYGVTSSGSRFVAGGTYTLTAPGGVDVPAFSQMLMTPSDLTVTTPNVNTTVAIDKTADLSIAWTSIGGSDPVIVSISQDDGNSTTVIINCKFADTGSATIAKANLSPLVSDSAIPNGGTSMTISKINFVQFTVPGAGTAAGVGSSDWNYNAMVP